MSIFHLIWDSLGETCFAAHFFSDPSAIESIELLDEKTRLRPKRIYISGSRETVSWIQQRKAELSHLSDSLLLISAKPSSNHVLQAMAEKYHFNMLQADVSEAALGICAADAVNYYLRAGRMLEECKASHSLGRFLTYLSEFTGEEVCLYNSVGTFVTQTSGFSSSLKKKITRSFHDILLQKETHSFEQNPSSAGREKEGFCFVKIKSGQVLKGVLFFSTGQQLPQDYPWLFGQITPLLSRMLFLEMAPGQNGQAKFTRLWTDIIENRFSSSGEIRESFLKAGYATKTFLRLVLIQPEQTGAQAEAACYEMLPILKDIIPDSQMTMYLGGVVIVAWEEERSYTMPVLEKNRERLEHLLSDYQGLMCYGWCTRNLEDLPVLYSYSCKELFLRKQMTEREEHSRILHFGSYCPFLITDLCIQHVRSHGNVRDIVALCHPAVINLYRYDLENQNNLELTLFYYIINHHSLEKTAASLFMHRNTVVNKIKKIRELIDMDLMTPENQAHLVFSHYILLYCLHVMDMAL